MAKRIQRSLDDIRAESKEHRLIAWNCYQENLRQGIAETEAIRQALLKALPPGVRGSTNRNRELGLWKTKQLWPPPELDGVLLPADTVQHRKTLSDSELLRRAKEILMQDLHVAERPTTAKGRESTLKTTMLAGRFPNDLVAELEALGGRKSHHLEKALRLYLKLVKEDT